jgi:hypothetical protein
MSLKSRHTIPVQQWADLTDIGFTISPIELSKADLSVIHADVEKLTSNTNDGVTVSPGRIHFELVGNKVFADSKEVQSLLSSFQPMCRKYFGPRYPHVRLSTVQLVQSSPGSCDQCWHADNADKGLTFIIPLIDITKQNGTTQLVTGSHNLLSVRKLEIASPVLTCSDLLVMDARLLHRGSKNISTDVRPILVFRYDDVKTPAPGSGYFGAILRNAIGNILFSLLS